MICPICGSEIEIAEVIDYDEMEEKSFDVAMYLSEHPQLRHCVRITTRCCTCHKGLWLTFHKPSFPDMETMQKLAKELFAEKRKESEETMNNAELIKAYRKMVEEDQQ